jgi:hypothetical protein
VRESDWTTWTLDQPTARRRDWELRHGPEVRGSLRVPVFGSGARADTPELRLRIERLGRLRATYAVVDEATGGEIARTRREGRRLVLELDGLVGEWKRVGKGFGFIGRDERPLVSARVRSGVLRSSGEVRIDPQLGEREATVAALLACYLLIRRNEDAAAGAGASTAAVTS